MPSVDYYNGGRPNAVQVEAGGWSLWFSYRTLVAFMEPGGTTVKVSENCWGPTTGRHLNCIDGGDKDGRLPRAEFDAAYTAAVEGVDRAIIAAAAAAAAVPADELFHPSHALKT